MSESLIERRARLMGPNVPTFYETPVHIVRGEGAWLWDADGRQYLDAYNNVAHVGHCHPKVTAAIDRQSRMLATHTRYLHEGVLDYIEALTATLGHGLSQAIMVCTGSEANDIALRMAQAVTGKRGIIATDNTYHGNTLATSQLSTRRPPIGGYPAHVRLVPAPDSLRPVGGTVQGQSEAFACNVARAIAELEDSGHGFSGMIICPFFANEGFPTLTKDFFAPTEAVIRRARGLLIADEVQPGFGRLGTHFWGHEWLGVRPDVVTMGKSIANGYPAAAVVTRPDVMAEFREAFGYFNTFGGNPVAAAACMATLQVMQEEPMQENARLIGEFLLENLRLIEHPMIAEVRGQGLFFGIEFVTDAEMTPATRFTAAIVEKMRHRGILLNRIGRHMNTLKMRPPLPISISDAENLLEALSEVIAETPVPE